MNIVISGAGIADSFFRNGAASATVRAESAHLDACGPMTASSAMGVRIRVIIVFSFIVGGSTGDTHVRGTRRCCLGSSLVDYFDDGQ